MAKSKWCRVHLLVLLTVLFIFSPREASSQVPAMCSIDKDICGQGTCVPSTASLLGFVCECDPGWKKMQLGPLSFPSCVVPNCTVNLQRGNESPPNHFQFLSKLDFSTPCALTWCGDGTCVPDGDGHYCKCNEGSSNLFNMTKAACFKKGNLGTDCNVAALNPAAAVPVTAPATEKQSSSAGAEDATPAALTNNQPSSASSGNENSNLSSLVLAS